MRPDYNFLWFKKEDSRCSLRASVSLDGKLYLGRGLRAVLPRYIRLGFDERRKVLAIAVGRVEDIELPRCGVLNVQTLACRIQATGLRLPVTFLFTKDEMTGFYLGRVLPRRRCDRATGQRRYDPEQLLILYQHVLDEAVSKIARSTPLADRRAAAREAFFEAVEGYQAGCGEWEDYLQERICKHLLAENRPRLTASDLWTRRSPGRAISACTAPPQPPVPAGCSRRKTGSWKNSSVPACPHGNGRLPICCAAAYPWPALPAPCACPKTKPWSWATRSPASGRRFLPQRDI